MVSATKPTSNPFSTAQSVLYWALVLSVASFVFVHFLRTSGVNSHQPARIHRLLEGTATKPYVFRVLLPRIAETVSPIMNTEASLDIGIRSESILGRRIFRRDLDGKRHPNEVLLILSMMYLSLIGFAITVWHLLRDLGYPPIIRQAGPVLLLLGSVLFKKFGYFYDFTTLFLFTLGCLIMQRRQWPAYLFVFACATLNKETSIFLCLIFALSFVGRLPRRPLIMLLACQVGIYALLQGAIRFAFRNSPGSPLLLGFAAQVTALRDLAVNRPLMLLWSLMWLLIVFGLIAHRWRDKPVLPRAGLPVLGLLLVLYLVAGYPSEIRVFLEVYPLMVMLMLPPPWTGVAPAT